MELTNLEKIVLKAFNTYETLEGTQSDLGVSWTDAATLAKATGLNVGTVKGVLGSLVKKECVYASDEPGMPAAVCLTTTGAEWAHDESLVAATVADPSAEADAGQAALVAEQEEALFIEALIKAGADEEAAKAMGNPFPGIICSTLRMFAGPWTGTRKTFIATAQRAGFNKATAATQWQRARGKAPLPKE